MIRFAQLRLSVLKAIALAVLALAFFITTFGQGVQPQSSPIINTANTVTLHWGVRRGVSRYRLQVANDAAFSDILLDRVIAGVEYRLTELPTGKYFWRVAPVGTSFTESSAGVIEMRAATNDSPSSTNSKPAPSPGRVANPLGGWYAAIGNVSTAIVAHLRAPSREDLVAISSNNRVVALDAASGVELWAVHLKTQSLATPLVVRSSSGLDNILVFAASAAAMIDGKSGRALWQATLPAPASAALAVNGQIFVLDNSLQKLLIVNGASGQLIAQNNLARRAVGAPAAFELEPRAVILALDDGRIEVIDDTGKVLRAGNAQSAATTAPIFVRSTRGAFVLVGTKEGLTALSATDLRPLGRVNLKDDKPRGALAAVDVDGDRSPEVVMLTEHGQVFMIKSDEGRTLWTSDAGHADLITFADVNRDGALDVVMAKEGSAFALSGRDGTLVWKAAAGAIAANHAPAFHARSIIVARTGSGSFLITNEAGSGVRAIPFPVTGPR